MTGLDWDAGAYAHASTPQRAWGRALLDLYPWKGDEVVLDAGCGPGALTAELASRVPRGRVVAVDSDPRMVEAARGRLIDLASRVTVEPGDLLTWRAKNGFDVVFSNAVFHWVPDHDALFRRVFDWLNPRGHLLAQWGGSGNMARTLSVSETVRTRPPFDRPLRGWRPSWRFDTAADTRDRLKTSGFADVTVTSHEAPVEFPDRDAFLAFVRTAPILPYLSALPRDLRDAFAAAFADEHERLGWRLDYVRLTARARRPT